MGLCNHVVCMITRRVAEIFIFIFIFFCLRLGRPDFPAGAHGSSHPSIPSAHHLINFFRPTSTSLPPSLTSLLFFHHQPPSPPSHSPPFSHRGFPSIHILSSSLPYILNPSCRDPGHATHFLLNHISTLYCLSLPGP